MCSRPPITWAPDPFAVLNAAAQLTQRMRLRTYVLNVGFLEPGAACPGRRHHRPALRRAARARTRRRAHAKRARRRWLSWPNHRARVGQMEHILIEVQQRLSAPDHEPRPAQSRIPLAVGAMTSPGLRVAARHADIVAFSGLLQIRGASPGTFTPASAAQTRKRVCEVREHGPTKHRQRQPVANHR